MDFKVVPYKIDHQITFVAVFKCPKCSELLMLDATGFVTGAVYDCPCGKAVSFSLTASMEMLKQAREVKNWVGSGAAVSTLFESTPKLLQRRSKAL